MAWATRLYTLDSGGSYKFERTPDDRPLVEQDAFFMRCLEAIVGVWNMKLSEGKPRGKS